MACAVAAACDSEDSEDGIPGPVEIAELGAESLGPGQESRPFTVQVPSDAASLMLIADGGSAPDVDLSSLTAPDGTTWVTRDRADVDPIGRSRLQAAGGSVAAGLFPHHASYALLAGAYTVHVATFGAPATVRVLSIVNRRTASATGVLDVNLVLCGIPEVNARIALVHPQFRIIYAELERLLGLFSIRIGRVVNFDCAATVASRLTVIDPADGNGNGQPDELDELFGYGAVIPNQALSLFFVQRIGDGVPGLAGGLPGPALIQGTAHSGVVVATFGAPAGQSEASLKEWGRTAAREVMHYLGLFHTTEAAGANGDPRRVDPLADTPECPPSRDADGNGRVDVGECLDLDGTNFLFWTTPLRDSGIVQEWVTAEQRFVVQRSPYVRSP